MRKKSYILILLITILLSGCDTTGKQEGNKKNSTNQNGEKQISNTVVLRDASTNQIVTITKEGDKKYNFKEHEGKVVLVNFFATWCPPCKAEIPHLVNLQNRYKDDFVIIAVLLEDGKDPEEVKSFMNYYGVNYIVTNSLANFDYEKLLGGVQSIPYMAMYDRDGNFVIDYKGAVPEEMIESDIKRAMEN